MWPDDDGPDGGDGLCDGGPYGVCCAAVGPS